VNSTAIGNKNGQLNQKVMDLGKGGALSGGQLERLATLGKVNGPAISPSPVPPPLPPPAAVGELSASESQALDEDAAAAAAAAGDDDAILDEIINGAEDLEPQQGDTDVPLGARINWRLHAALKTEAFRGQVEKLRYGSIKDLLEEAVMDVLRKVQAERVHRQRAKQQARRRRRG